MTIIGVESSALVASVAIMSDDRLVAEYTMNNKKTHSQTLLPMLDEIVRAAELNLNEVDAIAISKGPGSFTGLRIGSATAKGLGLALEKPLVEVSTLESMAYGLYGVTDALICPIMDARRAEVYSGVYRFIEADTAERNETADCMKANCTPVNLVSVCEENAGPLIELIEKLNAMALPVIFLGDGVPVYADLIADKMKVKYSFAPEHLSRQRAASVAALGMKMFTEGKTVDASEHAPTYLRVSQAEREKNGGEN